MGIERILALMNETGVKIHQSEADAYVVYQGEMASKFCWKVAEYFRDNGLKVILHCGGGNFKSQMKKQMPVEPVSRSLLVTMKQAIVR